MISVIMTRTDDSPFLDEACASFERQNFKDAELIVMKDNGAGRPATLNRAAKEAVGNWLMWLDSDDLLRHGSLEKIARATKQPSVKSIFTGWEHSGKKHVPVLSSDPAKFKAGWAVCVRRSVYDAVGGFDESYPFACTMDFRLRVHERGNAVVLPEPLYWFREHAGRITRKFHVQQREGVERAIDAAIQRRGLK